MRADRHNVAMSDTGLLVIGAGPYAYSAAAYARATAPAASSALTL